MYDFLIQKYVERMTLEDVDKFALQNGVELKEEECRLITSTIKKDYRTIIFGNPRKIFDALEKELEPLTYKKMIQLYSYFKEKYQNYLS